ncbi:MAG: preprotein translocase subunit SecY [Candidatus Syntrophoarchaeum sp.]|nr:preprotein translocase subunit SecY [Methanomicrobia archaeon]MBL7117796.1 preprotein translocase subunit SecY [Candidatus Syntrophoarchaeum sp.]
MRLRDALTPILSKFPMVERPGWHVHFKAKLGWTVAILVLFFALGNVPLFGLGPDSLDLFGRWRAIFAGERFSLTALGIMPIVDASIVLQLLVGSGIIKLNLSDPKDQAFYQNIQKLLVVVFAVFISLTYVVGFYKPNPEIASQLGVSLQVISLLLFIQVFLGGMLIYFMDEVVSKWGIGSGVSLFIIAGVSQAIITGLISPIRVGGWAVGVIPRWIQIAGQVPAYEILEGGIIFLFENYMIALISTIAVFFFVVYLESTRVEIPLAHSMARGARGKFPIKLLYASVLPMILVRALQASIQGFGQVLYKRGITIFGTYDGYGNAISGLMYYLDPIYSPWDWFPGLVTMPHAGWQIATRLTIDLSFMVIGGAIFALFWINTTGMGSKDVASQIHRSGMQIPGHRRSPATVERLMEGYIPKIALMGGAILGVMCVVSNMFGTLGQASGTGLLLAVSIAYRLYEDVASEQMMEMFPAMRRFFGEG